MQNSLWEKTKRRYCLPYAPGEMKSESKVGGKARGDKMEGEGEGNTVKRKKIFSLVPGKFDKRSQTSC